MIPAYHEVIPACAEMKSRCAGMVPAYAEIDPACAGTIPTYAEMIPAGVGIISRRRYTISRHREIVFPEAGKQQEHHFIIKIN